MATAAEYQEAVATGRRSFPAFANACLKVLPKIGGRLEPLAFNRAQWHIHNAIEKQRAEIGMVRAMILKARKQGACLDPDTRVLTADLQWIPLKDVRVGQSLVATDEHAGVGKGKGQGHRQLRTAVVEKVWDVRKPAYRITFDDGRQVVCSAEHRWLALKSQPVPKWRSISGDESGAHDSRGALRVGDVIRSVATPWGDRDFDDAWFGGMIDGEGSLDFKSRSGVDIAVTQCVGDVLSRMTAYCETRGYRHCVIQDKRRTPDSGYKECHAVSVCNIPDLFRMIGLCRPTRFIGRSWWDGKRLPHGGWRRIVAIEAIGERRLIDLQTSTQTFIAEGFVSHNSTYVGARFYHKTSLWGGQKATVIAHKQSSTDYLFEMVERYHKNNPIATATETKTVKELSFSGTDSSYSVATAGSADIGRGGTGQLLHASECAFWKNAETHEAGIGNIIARVPGTEIIKETTANGIGNLFHQQWQMAEVGEGDYLAIFVPWFWEPDYVADVPEDFELSPDEEEYRAAYKLTLGQMAWRRIQVKSYGHGFAWLFDQEFPSCISGNARVSTQRGMLRLRDVVAGDTCATGVVSAAQATGTKSVVKVRTKMGYEVVCTPEHRMGLESDGWLRADACVGERIKLQPPRFADTYATVNWDILPGGVRGSVTIDEAWGRFLGYYMGDGSFYGGGLSIACEGTDTDVVLDVEGLLRQLIGEPRTRTVGDKGGCREVRVERQALKPIFDAMGISYLSDETNNTKRLVCVPECIWQSPKSVVREFLRGLFESDGFAGYGHPRVSLFSQYVEFLKDVQLLLLGFGVTSKFSSRPAINGSGFTYQANTLDLRSSESCAFGKNVGFVSRRKQGRAEAWMDAAAPKIGRGRYLMPLSDTVVSVEDAGQEEVFDLTVPGADSFDACGLLVHNCANVAFKSSTGDPYISPLLVSAAMNSGFYDECGPLIIGVDPAEGGADRTAIVWRRGRVVTEIRTYNGKNTMQVSGIVAKIIDEYHPDAVFLDKIGIGAGIYSRLRELGHGQVFGFVSGERASEPDIYANKRAECMARCKKWLEDAPVRLPNDPELAADMSAPGYDHDSAGKRLLIESKKDMKKRGIRSPDLLDALCFTFADFIGCDTGDNRGGYEGHQPATSAGY